MPRPDESHTIKTATQLPQEVLDNLVSGGGTKGGNVASGCDLARNKVNA